jgi:hypothetical protein
MNVIWYCKSCKDVIDWTPYKHSLGALEIAEKLNDVFHNGRDYECDLYRKVIRKTEFKSGTVDCRQCRPNYIES